MIPKRPQAPQMNADTPRDHALVELGEEGPINENEQGGRDDAKVDWASLARDALSFSTTYMESNYRKRWEDGLRAFNNQHPLDSKYNNPAYDKRSKLFRPKTRSAIRKNEAASAAAFFASEDIISVAPVMQSDPAQRASADINKALLQYRLGSSDQRVSVPWFQVLQGALQDAQTVGVCISRQYWDYSQHDQGKTVDKPCVKLIAVENFRLDPAASWLDPIGTSPYLIELMPLYVYEVRERMAAGEWKTYSLGDLQDAQNNKLDSTRSARNKNRTDPYAGDEHEIGHYETVWIQRHIHYRQNKDWVFYVMGDGILLSQPKPLIEEVFHGQRDYVMGMCVLETHKLYPPGLPELSRPVQDEVNEITNQSLDNTKFVLNKRWFVRRGKNVDLASLSRNVPGGITMVDDPETDVKEVNWPDITSSTFEQQNRLAADFSDLVGDFSPANSQLIAGRQQQPAQTMQIMAQSPAPLVDYLLRTFVNTWAQPVLCQLVKLEQQYETDQVILAIAADKAKLYQKYGLNQVTDDLLNRDLTVTVNLVFGALTPMAKLQRFNAGLAGLANIAKAQLPGVNMAEVYKESFSLMGYQSGERFTGPSPEQAQMAKAMQAKDQAIQELHKRVLEKDADRQLKAGIASEGNKTKIVTTVLKHEHEARKALLGHGQPEPAPPDLAQQAAAKQQFETEKLAAEQETKLEIAKLEMLTKLAIAELQANSHHAQQGQAATQQQAAKHHGDQAMQALLQEMKASKEDLAQALAALTTTLSAPKSKTAQITKGKDGQMTVELHSS